MSRGVVTGPPIGSRAGLVGTGRSGVIEGSTGGVDGVDGVDGVAGVVTLPGVLGVAGVEGVAGGTAGDVTGAGVVFCMAGGVALSGCASANGAVRNKAEASTIDLRMGESS